MQQQKPPAQRQKAAFSPTAHFGYTLTAHAFRNRLWAAGQAAAFLLRIALAAKKQ
jgi:hypothetical protein